MFPLTAVFDVGMKILDKFIPDPEAKAKAQQELVRMQQEGRLAELQADNIEAQELTKRQEADMASDSWLSKNIRPMTLIAILAGYFIFAMMSAFQLDANQKYVELLGQWGMINITQESRDGETYSNVATVMPLPPALRKVLPAGHNALGIFSMDQFEPNMMDLFNSFGKSLQDTIKASPEWAATHELPAKQVSPIDDADDDSPF